MCDGRSRIRKFKLKVSDGIWWELESLTFFRSLPKVNLTRPHCSRLREHFQPQWKRKWPWNYSNPALRLRVSLDLWPSAHNKLFPIHLFIFAHFCFPAKFEPTNCTSYYAFSQCILGVIVKVFDPAALDCFTKIPAAGPFFALLQSSLEDSAANNGTGFFTRMRDRLSTGVGEARDRVSTGVGDVRSKIGSWIKGNN